MSGAVQIALTVNGERVARAVDPRIHLVDFLRGELGLTGSHLGCEHGVCGACTVRVDGQTARGCLLLAVQADGTEVQTVEGLAADPAWDDLRAAFVARNALQCGYCTPGMLMSLTELLADNPDPSEEDVRLILTGHLCRCTGYTGAIEATLAVARAMRSREAA